MKKGLGVVVDGDKVVAVLGDRGAVGGGDVLISGHLTAGVVFQREGGVSVLVMHTAPPKKDGRVMGVGAEAEVEVVMFLHR